MNNFPTFLPEVIYNNDYIINFQYGKSANSQQKLTTHCSKCKDDKREDTTNLILIECLCTRGAEGGSLVCNTCYDTDYNPKQNNVCFGCNTKYTKYEFSELSKYYDICVNTQNYLYTKVSIDDIKERLTQNRNIMFFPLIKKYKMRVINGKEQNLCNDFSFACNIIDILSDKIISDETNVCIKDLWNFLYHLDRITLIKIKEKYESTFVTDEFFNLIQSIKPYDNYEEVNAHLNYLFTCST